MFEIIDTGGLALNELGRYLALKGCFDAEPHNLLDNGKLPLFLDKPWTAHHKGGFDAEGGLDNNQHLGKGLSGLGEECQQAQLEDAPLSNEGFGAN